MRFLVFIITLLCLPTVFAAAQLDARLSQYQVGIGETLELYVTLSQPDSNVVSEPDVSVLQDVLNIYSRNTSQSTQIINGRRSQEVTWTYQVEPLKQGELDIPSIRLNTASGVLSTQPLKLQVSRAGAPRQDGTELQVEVSNQQPYLYEPVHIKLRLTHLGDLRNPEPMMPNTGVVVEQISHMSAKKDVVNGRAVIVHEIEYLLTPMQSGAIDLGMIRMRASKQDRNSRNGQFGGLFSFNAYKQITVVAEPISLDVQMPSPSQIQSWLPLLNLKLDATWESDVEQTVTVGVPLIRTIKVIAAGMGGQPFPDLEQLITNNSDFRIRYSKPEVERKLLANTTIPATYITQTLSIIPLQVGEVTIPTFKMPWWDVNEKQMAWAEIPAQTLTVQANPNAIPTPQAITAPMAIQQVPSASQTIIQVQQVHRLSQIQFSLLGLSVIALIIALFQSWWKQRTPQTNAQTEANDHKTLSKKQFKQRLSNTLTPLHVQQLLQQFAHEQWQLPKNSALGQIGKTMQQQLTGGDELADLLKVLEKTLYAEQADFDLAQWKQSWLKTWQQARPISKVAQSAPPSIGSLNPV
ncbi:BatD family protein [Candidatus Albibeggiatoa sp. nov. NOAA]|uniref:BatD family protein n=1 Tax=Candidatus Albibeggiatoa sp. nov. NOAA TaxID=3162724 RepID=UPI0033007A3B|nr:BatD family protein [Thiotrichaceae bacterium]